MDLMKSNVQALRVVLVDSYKVTILCDKHLSSYTCNIYGSFPVGCWRPHDTTGCSNGFRVREALLGWVWTSVVTVLHLRGKSWSQSKNPGNCKLESVAQDVFFCLTESDLLVVLRISTRLPSYVEPGIALVWLNHKRPCPEQSTNVFSGFVPRTSTLLQHSFTRKKVSGCETTFCLLHPTTLNFQRRINFLK